MPKKLRRKPIYIASDIKGWLDKWDNPRAIDERTETELNPNNIDDKIIIYERQVKDWFLIPAKNLVSYNNKNKGFIVLMICLSYLEGIEQYRQGRSSRGSSHVFFTAAIQRLYPEKYSNHQLTSLYSEARCGLFHNGMVKGKIIINNGYRNSLTFNGDDIKISPRKFLKDITADFENYLNVLKDDNESRLIFNRMYTNI